MANDFYISILDITNNFLFQGMSHFFHHFSGMNHLSVLSYSSGNIFNRHMGAVDCFCNIEDLAVQANHFHMLQVLSIRRKDVL